MAEGQPQIPELVATRRAAQILGRSPATLKRWRYDLRVRLDFIEKNTRVPSVRAALEEITRGVV